MSAWPWPTCRQCDAPLEREHERWRCWLHGPQDDVHPPSRLANALALCALLVIGAGVALAIAATIFFGVAWLLSEGTP